MFKTIITKLLYNRHPWRKVNFDELGELYASMLLRSLALSLVALFVPLYLLRSGYSFQAIIVFYACFFTARILGDYLAGYFVARFGPKHAFIISYALQIVSLGMLITLKQVAWPLVLIGILWGITNSFFFVAYHVDFSKVKHTEHGGKELSWMHVMERLGGVIGPVLGGLIATYIGAQYTFFIAALLFVVGLIPLFLSGEPVKTHQKLDFTGLDYHRIKRDLFSYAALSMENNICINVWPFFAALFILKGNVYTEIGVLASAASIISLLTAHTIGSFIDRKKGRQLLRISAVVNAFVNVSRPFVSSFYGAFAVNMANETVTVGYRMPYIKGMYDAADDLPGHRIVYIVSMEMFGDLTKAFLYWMLFILSLVLSQYVTLSLAFFVAAAASIMIMSERFKSL